MVSAFVYKLTHRRFLCATADISAVEEYAMHRRQVDRRIITNPGPANLPGEKLIRLACQLFPEGKLARPRHL